MKFAVWLILSLCFAAFVWYAISNFTSREQSSPQTPGSSQANLKNIPNDIPLSTSSKDARITVSSNGKSNVSVPEDIKVANADSTKKDEALNHVEQIKQSAQFVLFNRIMDPNQLASEAMNLFLSSRPNLKSVEAISDHLVFSLDDLPPNIQGSFQMRSGIQREADSPVFDAVLEFPLSEPIWADGVPRRSVMLTLTMGLDQENNTKSYAVYLQWMTSGKLAEQHGINPEKTGIFEGIGYQRHVDGNFYAFRLESFQQKPTSDLSMIVGSYQLDEATQNNMREFFLKCFQQTRQEEKK